MNKIETDELLNRLSTDYKNLRRPEDGTLVGTLDLMFTRAIFIGLDEFGYNKRFCFELRSLADSEIAKLKLGTDEPNGYIARRGEGADEWYRTFDVLRGK